ncbi:hypothetical protein NL676_021074 [Syzygium grande]|nr:hypothetical protein NL676_021074 [Syzygium grande]
MAAGRPRYCPDLGDGKVNRQLWQGRRPTLRSPRSGRSQSRPAAMARPKLTPPQSRRLPNPEKREIRGDPVQDRSLRGAGASERAALASSQSE